MEELKSKNRVLLVLILAFLIVIVAFSVSIFSFAQKGTKDNVVNFGSLALTLSEGTEISLSDTYPMTDSEGVALTGYSFTLENTGTANATYSIYLDNVAVDSSDTKLDDKYVKYALTFIFIPLTCISSFNGSEFTIKSSMQRYFCSFFTRPIPIILSPLYAHTAVSAPSSSWLISDTSISGYSHIVLSISKYSIFVGILLIYCIIV